MFEENNDVKRKTVNFPMVFHFHQPVDNFSWVIEDCYDKAYYPLIEQMYNFSDIKFTLHFSGNLLTWFIENKPDLVDKLKEMSKRGQIEIIGGGFYEPIYAIIPDEDKIAQMSKLNDLIKDVFGLEVNGAWLSERVWEPNYPTFLNKVGLQYVIVDDNHLRSCGLEEKDTFYSYTTEDSGNCLTIFPINEKIRYLTPWKPTYMTIEYLKAAADEDGNRVVVLLSDAEKMGVWGTTNEICYVKGHTEGDNEKPFIEALFEVVSENDWIKSVTLTEYIENFNSKGLIYIPTASYDKMEQWVLPTDRRKEFEDIIEKIQNRVIDSHIEKFIKGGFWRYFLVKYPESNTMHKKMLYVRNKLKNIEDKILNLKSQDQKLNELLLKAWDEIYKSQCNDCYWHGQFGGIYLAFLRFSVFTHLIKAEKLIEEIETVLIEDFEDITTQPLNRSPRINILDFDYDSFKEITLESDIFNLYLKPQDGGTIFEFDYKPKEYNLHNVLTRWYEAYHDKEEVIIDTIRKSMLRILVFDKKTTVKEIGNNKYQELGEFVTNNFEIFESEIMDDFAIVKLRSSAYIKDPESGQKVRFDIMKTINLKSGAKQFIVSFNIKHSSEGTNQEILEKLQNDIRIGIEIPFFFNGDPSLFKYTFNEMELSDLPNSENKDFLNVRPFEKGTFFAAYDKTYDLTFTVKMMQKNEKTQLGKHSIKTFSRTNTGYQKIFQGLNLIVVNSLDDFELQFSIF